MNIVGTPQPHESAAAHVSGEALYTDDLVARLPNSLHAWPVCAPYAHAIVRHVDFTNAMKIRGFVTTLTDADVPGEGDSGSTRHDEPLFPREVLHHRQPVAWVLGDSLSAARAAAEAVEVTCDKLPAILTIEEAIAAESFHSGPFRMTRGDATAALDRAAIRISGDFQIGGQEHFYLETQCALAWNDASGGIVVDSSTQHPAETQEVVARVLGVPRHQVTVECKRMGGAFGGKEVQANPWAAIAALGVYKTGQPVRVRLTRNLDMALTGKRHPFLMRYDAGFSGDGRIEALRMSLYADGGWSLDLSDPVLARAMFHSDNAYFLPAVELTGYVCKTHKTSQTAFRGFGGPQGMLVIEEILDRAARRLGLAPDVIRERNFYRPGQTTHYGQTVKHAERIEQIWTQLKRTGTYDERRAAIAQFNHANRHTKRGLAITPVKFGISFTATFFNQAGATVLVYRDGSVQVNHGGTEMGQGLYTKIRQIAAEALGGVPLDKIRVMPTSTGKVPNTSATAASAGADLNGAAVADACRQIRERLEALEAPVGTSFTQLCEIAYKQRTPLFAAGFYATPGIHYDPKTFTGKPFHYYAYGAAISEVEIDRFTGQYRLLRADLLEDVGCSLSPVIDRGQIEGGFIQGTGWLTLEELVWDPTDGRLATAGASTYKLPSWSEVPPDFRVDFLERAADPDVIYGSKAVGEPPLMLAISVRHAILDAIGAFGPSSFELASPATPERVFFAIRAARANA